jgi:hypothetical protein
LKTLQWDLNIDIFYIKISLYSVGNFSLNKNNDLKIVENFNLLNKLGTFAVSYPKKHENYQGDKMGIA